jgi:hypothetical protein
MIPVALLAVQVILIYVLYKFVSGERSYGIWVAVLSIYTLYLLYNLYKEYSSYRRDKKMGLETRDMLLMEYKHIYQPSGSEAGGPCMQFGIFTIQGSGEIIQLSGNFSNVKIETGKVYKVSFYTSSKHIVSIKMVGE